MDAWRIYNAAKRHRYLVGFSVLVAVAGAVIVSFFLPRYWVATATLLPSEAIIRQNAPSAADVEAPAPAEGSTRDRKVANLVVLARSRTVADRVSKRVHIPPIALLRLVDCQRIARAESGVATDMIGVSVRYSDPSTAVEIANIWADEFSKFHLQVSQREAEGTRLFLEALLRNTRVQLDRAAADLAAFRRRNLVADLPQEISAAISELTPLRAERDQMRARVADIEARLNTRRQQAHGLTPTRTITSAEVPAATIDALQKSIGDAKAELLKLTQIYTDDYYRVKQLRQQIADAQAELSRQQRLTQPVARVMEDPAYAKIVAEVKDLQSDLSAGQARLARLDNLIQGRESQMGAFSDLDFGLSARKRTYEEADKRYAAVAAQVHAARLGERIAAEAGAIKIIDEAKSADGPKQVGPSLPQLILCGILLGLLVGVTIVVAVETLDTRVRTATDAAQLLELPVTGIIPSIPTNGGPPNPSALISHNSPMSPFAESYHFLATEVLLDANAEENRSIMVATAKPNQGGTSTLCNLAITLAQAGRRVVLMDADLRRPSLHKLFRVPNDIGLADVLRDDATVVAAMKTTPIENLALMTAGSNIDNPWALLKSPRLHKLVEEMKQVADYVLVDVPSAIVFADAATVASVVDSVLVVVRANESPRGCEFQVKGLLNKANPNIIGVVLNDVPAEDVDSCHYYAHYYSAPSLLKGTPRRPGPPREELLTTRDSRPDSESDGYVLDDEGRT